MAVFELSQVSVVKGNIFQQGNGLWHDTGALSSLSTAVLPQFPSLSLSLHPLFCLHGAGLVTCLLPVDLVTVWKTRRGPKYKTTHGRQGNKRRALFKRSWMIQKSPDKPKTRHADNKKDEQQKRGWNKVHIKAKYKSMKPQGTKTRTRFRWREAGQEQREKSGKTPKGGKATVREELKSDPQGHNFKIKQEMTRTRTTRMMTDLFFSGSNPARSGRPSEREASNDPISMQMVTLFHSRYTAVSIYLRISQNRKLASCQLSSDVTIFASTIKTKKYSS